MSNFTKPPVQALDAIQLTGVLVPDVYRRLGSEYADHLFARAMDGEDNDRAIEEITWGQLMRQSYHVAASLCQGVVNPTAHRVVGILATSGYEYYVHVVAAWLNHWTVQLLSPRNSIAGLLSLLNSVHCTTLIVDSTHIDVGTSLQNQMPGLSLLPMEDFSQHEMWLELGGQSAMENVNHHHRTDKQLDCIAVYTHTSGSQGHPKPVPLSHRHFLADTSFRAGIQFSGAPLYSPNPLYHGMGFYSFTRWPIGSGLVPTFIRTKKPINGDTVLQHLKRLPGAISFLTPALLEEASQRPDSELAVLLSCQRIFFGGAPIDPRAAEKLIRVGVPLVSVFGSSELSILSKLDYPSKDILHDWSYFDFRGGRFTLHFIPYEGSPLCELVVSPGLHEPAIINCHEPYGFKSDDLWEAHPTKPGLWKHAGRKGSVIVLSNGEKTDSQQLESLLTEDPRIRHAIVFGAGKVLNGVLISPAYGSGARDTVEFLTSIWPTIERVNSIVPKHSRLIKQMVLVARAEKPIAITDKGTVRTQETLQLYSKEIEAAFNLVDSPQSAVADANSDVLPYIRSVIQQLAGGPVGDNDDLFDAGLDSLHAVQVRIELSVLLARPMGSYSALPHNLLYDHPTINQLAHKVDAVRKGDDFGMSSEKQKIARVQSCIDRWTENFRDPIEQRAFQDGHIIIITGSTGSLGCHLLQHLLTREDVKRVYCFHRGPAATALERQKGIFEKRHIPVDLLLNRNIVEFVSVDLSHPTLALESEVLHEMRCNVTHVIHCAWELNFNWGLERFEKVHIAGVRHLIDLAMSSFRSSPLRFVFISSIAAVNNSKEMSPVAECAFEDISISANHGYGEAKYVAERIIDLACKAGLHATVIRSGQLSGSTSDGYWNSSEYIPIILRSSQVLRAIPHDLPDARWLPIDVAAKCVLELSFHGEASSPAYYSLQNPTATPWLDLVRLFTHALGRTMTPVPLKQWITLVSETGHDKRDIPAISLLHFYSSMARRDSRVVLSTQKCRQVCAAVKFGPITADLVDKYATWMKVAT